MLVNSQFWQNRRVFLTGHTGFKGSWLTLWLAELGARIHGYALAPTQAPNLFDLGNAASGLITDTRADISNLPALSDALNASGAEIVFHLAAQSLVRSSYDDPIGTFATNIMGTANLLEAVRHAPQVKAVVIVTTDKCYENREWAYAYRENDSLGGHDSYSASKACAEIVTASFRSSFFTGKNRTIAVATARAGNVIGGGDWCLDRLIPDCIRAFSSRQALTLRYPNAIRPWQHVLEPLRGYLILAERLMAQDADRYATAFNFGPDVGADATVSRVAHDVAYLWGGGEVTIANAPAPHEATLLRLDSSKAHGLLGWRTVWPLPVALQHTVAWYKAWHAGMDMQAFTLQQIRDYTDGLPV